MTMERGSSVIEGAEAVVILSVMSHMMCEGGPRVGWELRRQGLTKNNLGEFQDLSRLDHDTEVTRHRRLRDRRGSRYVDFFCSSLTGICSSP